MTTIILLAAGTMLVLALFMAYVLGWANVAFHVELDPRQQAVQDALPGANCGGCGFIGCNEYAEAVVAGEAPVDKCPVGGTDCAAKLANILGVEINQSWPQRPVVHCGATYNERLGRNDYLGEPTCTAANMVAGVQGCAYGCMGFGDCVAVCDFDAIHVVNGLSVVDYDACVGCGACERICPRHVINLVPFKDRRMLVVACSNMDFGKDVKTVCTVGCIGCKMCQKLAAGLITVVDNMPTVDYDAYDPNEMDALDAAIAKCPAQRLTMVTGPSQATNADPDAAPLVVEPDFQTTVDKTDWHG